MSLVIFNTLSREKEEFNPILQNIVSLYTCGPTVYNYAHIGNLRTYIFEDILKRTLFYNGYAVKHVMNITDVGHLTGDRDMGEDKLEKADKDALYLNCKNCKKMFFSGIIDSGINNIYRNNTHYCQYCGYQNLAKDNSSYYKIKKPKTSYKIAKFYTKKFKEDLLNLNIIYPNRFCKATDNIKEQIKIIEILEKKGFTYKTSDGVYFDTGKVEDYNKLSHQNLEELREGARVEINEDKKSATDFALWKFSPLDTKRQMEWKSPWGVGFPGWHIECSAMSLKYLGDHFDIHCGGIDHINIHHTNEIAQTEAYTGRKPWVNYWMHGAFLNLKNDEKMSKSTGGFITINSEFVNKHTNPLVYRYATFGIHYRKQMEWNDEILSSAKSGYSNLVNKVRNLGKKKGKVDQMLKQDFLSAINDDLNMPKAMAILQEVLKSELDDKDKLATVLDFDKVLGLGLDQIKQEKPSREIKKLLKLRSKARTNKDWKESDKLRYEINKLGYEVKDTDKGQEVFNE